MLIAKSRFKKGFTIVEVMIIIATLAMLCAFIMPRLMTSKLTSNEAVARQVLKSASSALEEFEVGAYPEDIINFINNIKPRPDCSDIVSGALTFEESGYWFIYLPGELDYRGNRATYDFYAVPLELNITGIHSYVINEKGVIHIDSGSISAYVDKNDAPVL